MMVILLAGYVMAQTQPVTIRIDSRARSGTVAPNGTLPAVFGIYSGTSGAPVWSESHPAVVFRNGFFEVTLGDINPGGNPLLVQHFDIPTANLGVQVAGNTYFIPLVSQPYAVVSKIAEEARSASASVVTGAFTAPVVINGRLIVNSPTGNVILHANPTTNRVGIRTATPAERLDVNGVVNALELNVNGQLFTDTLAWKKNTVTTENIYYPTGNVGIGLNAPMFGLHVFGVVNAEEIIQNGHRLTAILDWKHPTSPISATPNLYFNTPDGRIGIGTIRPRAELDVVGGIRVGNSTGTNPGTIRYSPLSQQIEGYVSTADGWVPLTGVRGVGTPFNIATFQNAFKLNNNPQFHLDLSKPGISINNPTPDSRLDIQLTSGNITTSPFTVRTSTGNPVIYVSPSGNVGIGTATTNYKLNVAGALDASKLTLNGKPLTLALSKGTYWLLNARDDLYYTLGNVGIGRPDPTALLELAARNKAPHEPFQDPAILLTSADGTRYIMGVDADNSGIFQVEKSQQLGTNVPLFVAQEDRFGTGVRKPDANLHVSGNTGILLTGTFFGTKQILDEQEELADILAELGTANVTSNLPVEGPGVRFLFYPRKSVLRAGVVDPFSPLAGTEWDDENLGIFSIGLGRNAMASGNLSLILGGLNNRAGGAYSTVIGGELNNAAGDFSFAAGYRAAPTRHGTFVWGDFINNTTIPRLSPVAENQFIIQAGAGVGINTSATTLLSRTVALTVEKTGPTGNIIRTIGRTGTPPAFNITTSGNVRIGTEAPVSSSARVTVMNGGVSIGTTNATADLMLYRVSTQNYLFMAIGQHGINSPAFVIDGLGDVGIGITPNFEAARPQSVQVDGKILAERYLFPDGQEIGATPVLVWSHYLSTPNIYFPSGNYTTREGLNPGNVGVGSFNPRSLLQLSDTGSKAFERFIDPKITFNNNGADSFSFGLSRNSPNLLRFERASTFGSAAPQLAIASYNVGIGMTNPQAVLHIGQNAVFEGTILISTTNASYSIALDQAEIGTLYIDGEQTLASGSQWNISTLNHTYRDVADGNVGIGVVTASATLEVNGTVSANSFVIKNSLSSQGIVALDQLNFDDDGSETPLEVRNGKLFLGQFNAISDVLSLGQGLGGKIALWTSQGTNPLNSLQDSGLTWISPTTANAGELHTLYPFRLQTTRAVGPFQAANTVRIGTENVLTNVDLISSLTHDGNLTNSRPHTVSSLNIIVDNWPVTGSWISLPPDPDFDIRGLSIKLANIPNSQGNTFFSQNGRATGVMVDMENVLVQEFGEPGHKYPALFRGNVGINTFPVPDPLSGTILDVNGTVLAVNFVISQRLSISTINVGQQTFTVPESGNVGINTTNPSTDLEVVGTIIANSLSASAGFAGNSLDVNNGKFVVTNTGTVGMGITQPTAQWEIFKQFDATPVLPYSAKVISQNVMTNLDADTIGLSLDIDSDTTNDFLGNTATNRTAIGLNVNLSTLNGQTGSKIIGFKASTPATGNSVAAIFMGGNVGIGKTQPEFALDVSGTIRAKDVLQTSLLTLQEAASFNYLDVTNNVDSALFLGSVVANNMYVNTMNVTNQGLIVSSTVDLPAIQLNLLTSPGVLVANVASFNTLLETLELDVSNNVTADTGVFSRASIGTPINQDAALAVVGTIRSDEMTVSKNLQAALLQSDNSRIVVTETGLVGLGTATPRNQLHIHKLPYPNAATPTLFNAANNLSWNAIRVQNASNIPGTAAGVLLLPNDASLTDAGSGFVARRTAGGGSELLFLSDANSGTPTASLVISEDGNVGIGTETPGRLFQLNGTGIIGPNLTIGGTLISPSIRGINGIAALTSLNVVPTLDVTRTLGTEKRIELALQPAELIPTGNLALLYGLAADGGLYFATQKGGGIIASGNITSTFSATTNTIPYYTSGYRLDETNQLLWVTENMGVFQWDKARYIRSSLITSANLVEVHNTIPSVNITPANFTAQHVSLGFLDRTQAGTSTFSAVDISLASDQTITANEVAVGLRVDMRNLRAKSSTNLPPGLDFSIEGFKHTALFEGGSVGIATSVTNGFNPEAAMHVSQGRDGIPALSVVARTGTSTTVNALFVDHTGYVGVGTVTPPSRLSLVTVDNTALQSVFALRSNTNAPFVLAQNDGNIGIGTAAPKADLHVAGTLLAKTIQGDILQPTTMNINNSVLVVQQNGNIGINTPTPTAQLDVTRAFQSPNAQPFVLESIRQVINRPDVDHDLTGIGLTIASDADNYLGGSDGTPRTATGMRIDMRNLTLRPGARINGMMVVVSPNMDASRNAAVFLGGNVGIGFTQPTQALDINGTLRAEGDLILNNALALNAVESASFNSLYVSENAVLNQVFANQAAPTPGVEVTQTATFNVFTKVIQTIGPVPTFNADTITAKLATFNTMAIATGTGNITDAFTVSGNALFRNNLTIAGNNTLTVNRITATGVLTVNSSKLAVNDNLTISVNAKSRNAFLAKTTTPSIGLNQAALFTADYNDELMYINGSATANLSENIVGIANRVPFYDPNGFLSDEAYITWESTLVGPDTFATFAVGTTNMTLTGTNLAEVQATIPSVAFAQSPLYRAKRVKLGFLDRTAASLSVFSGMDVTLQSADNIAEDERGIGLMVDVRNLHARSSTDLPNEEDNDIVGFKYAALFEGGSVGISAKDAVDLFEAEASLHVQNVSSKSGALYVEALRKDPNTSATFTVTALTVSSNGYVGVGTAIADARLTVVPDDNLATNLAFTVRGGGAPVLAVRNNGQTGIGTTTPQNTLHLVNTTTARPALRIDRGLRQNALFVADNGNVGIGTGTPAAGLHSNGDFRVDAGLITGAVSLLNSASGNIGLQTVPTTRNAIHASGNVLAGTASIVALPSWINSSTISSRGLISASSSDLGFFGLRNYVGTAAANPDSHNTVIYWGDNTTDSLVFERRTGTAGSAEALRMTGTGLIGLNTNVPSASLHIRRVGVNDRVFQIATTAIPHALTMLNSGFIGINTANPTVELAVSGNLIATSIIDEPTFGTELQVATINVINEGLGMANSRVNAFVTKGSTGEELLMNVGLDLSQDITGVSVSIQSADPAFEFLNLNPVDAYGMKVNIRGLFTKDPNFGTSDGQKFAAIFRGGNVGVGTANPQVAFEAIAFNHTNYDSLPTGNIASFASTANIIPGGSPDPGSELILAGMGNITMPVSYRSNFHPDQIISANIFKAIVYELEEGETFGPENTNIYYTDTAKANEIFNALKAGANPVIDDVNNMLHTAVTNRATLLTRIQGLPDTNGYILPYIHETHVYKVLLPYVERTYFSVKVLDRATPNIIHTPLMLTSGYAANAPIDTLSPQNKLANAFKFAGRVGINITEQDATSFAADNAHRGVNSGLVINGNMRVGQRRTAFIAGSPGEGNRLYFSGGPLAGWPDFDSENSDSLFMSRYNNAVNSSELRVNIGESAFNPEARFIVGRSVNFLTSTMTPVLSVRASTKFQAFGNNGLPTSGDSGGNDISGFVGVGLTDPKTRLHIKGVTNGNAGVPADNLAILERIGTTHNDLHSTLEIRHIGDEVPTESNFITFLSAPIAQESNPAATINALGAIEGNDAGGVQFSSPEADYAEYLQKKNPKETFDKGDVVGIFAGRISKTTKGADNIMVISSAGIVVGNMPTQNHTMYEPVAFLGQVPVKTRNKVSKGDYIVASGRNDGTAIALAPSAVTSEHIDKIIGMAWEESDNPELKKVNTLIGFPFALQSLGTSMSKANSLKTDIESVRKENRELKRYYDKMLKDREEKIKQIKTELAAKLASK